jgi:hypothetical protein
MHYIDEDDMVAAWSLVAAIVLCILLLTGN